MEPNETSPAVPATPDSTVQSPAPTHPFISVNGLILSTETDKLDTALATAQGKIKAAKKNAENAAFKKDGKPSKFADMEAVYEACRSALSEAGISVTQWPRTAQDFASIQVTTRLAHAGQFIMNSLTIPARDKTAHGVSGAITYARRVALNAIVGIAADEEDDGNNASGVETPGQNQHGPPIDKKKVAAEAQRQAELKAKTPRPQQEEPPLPDGPPPEEMFPEEAQEHPDYENEALSAIAEATRLRGVLNNIAKAKFFPADEMGQIIQRVTGRKVKSQSLSVVELQKVIAYVEPLAPMPDPKVGGI